MTFDELRTLVEGVRATETMLASPVDKDAVAVEMAEMRDLFMKSIVPGRDLEAGAVLRVEDLTTKNRLAGFPPSACTILSAIRSPAKFVLANSCKRKTSRTSSEKSLRRHYRPT